MKKVLPFFFLIVFGLSFSFAQNSKSIASDNQQNIEGTYQIQVINSRNKPYIPYNLKELVISNRDKTKINYVTIGTEVRLMILPLSEIAKKDFKPLQAIAYVNE